MLGWVHDFQKDFHSQIARHERQVDTGFGAAIYFIFNARFKKPPKKLAAKVRIIEP